MMVSVMRDVNNANALDVAFCRFDCTTHVALALPHVIVVLDYFTSFTSFYHVFLFVLFYFYFLIDYICFFFFSFLTFHRLFCGHFSSVFLVSFVSSSANAQHSRVCGIQPIQPSGLQQLQAGRELRRKQQGNGRTGHNAGLESQPRVLTSLG